MSSAQNLDDFEAYKAQQLAEFEQYREDENAEFEAFRKKQNEEFAEFMRKQWSDFRTFNAVPVPQRPEPPKPVVKSAETKPMDEPQQLVVNTPPAITTKAVKETADRKRASKKSNRRSKKATSTPYLDFDFYGTPCSIPVDGSYRFTLEEVSNNGIADVWQLLSTEKYFDIAERLIELRGKLNLCDWGYVCLADIFARSLMGNNRINEARVLQMFILTQSGYKMRIAQNDGRILLLMPFAGDINIYAYPYITKEGHKYYILDKECGGQLQISVFDREFPNENLCSLEMDGEPALKSTPAGSRKYRSKKYEDLNATVAINRNIIDFYNSYPVTDAWDMYVRTSLSNATREQFYPQLLAAIESKSKTEAADILLNFVQTAFEYKTDREQFGRERPLFAEETLYYPFCDCEDRSILYAILVRELLELDVVLLNYPTHLATAVDFGKDIPGKYISYKGKHYFVCDPTYIGASIGEAMPNLDSQEITIVEI